MMGRLFAFLSLVVAVSASSWDYGTNGPSTWSSTYSTCGGSNQSPIDVVSSSAVDKDVDLSLSGYSTAAEWTIENNGHSISMTPPSSVSYTAECPDAYNEADNSWTLLSFHFHWGSTDSQGSENTLDGQQYPMEVHFVHTNDKYSSGHTGYDDGLLVLGFFFEIGSSNSAFDAVVDELTNVTYEGNSSTTGSFTPSDLIGTAVDSDEFYYWQGSLTTPNCDEAVSWVLFNRTISISSSQMAAFRSGIYDNTMSQMEDNYRPVQTLGSRTVYVNSEDDPSAAPVLLANAFVLLIVGIVCLF